MRHTRHRILVLVDEVLGDVLHHELVGLLGHPGVHEGREVKCRGTVERELIVDELVGRLRVGALGEQDVDIPSVLRHGQANSMTVGQRPRFTSWPETSCRARHSR